MIQARVRADFPAMRACYERGLARRRTLHGRVVVVFVIDRDGLVSSAQSRRSDLDDAEVVACIVRRFGGLKFPRPKGGPVTVVYPITFAPAE